MELVYVEWLDIHDSTEGWKTHEELVSWAKEPWIVKQAGWLFEETDKRIIIVNMICEPYDMVSHMTDIPKGCILTIKKIEISEENQ